MRLGSTKFNKYIFNTIFKSLCLYIFFIISISFLCSSSALSIEKIPNKIEQASLNLAPYLQVFVDKTGKLSIQDIESLEIQKKFKNFNDVSLQKEHGVLWLRFTLAPRPTSSRDKTNDVFFIDLGDYKYYNPVLYTLKNHHFTKELYWQVHEPHERAMFLMPKSDILPITSYIRMDAIPGIWFAPVLRSPQNVASSYEIFAHSSTIIALAMVMLVCLLRGLSEKGQWRFWAGLYTASTLFYVIFGVPVGNISYIPMEELPKAIAPGIALILLPHVGRHLTNSAQKSRAIDLQLITLSLVGIALALIPLIPGLSWVVRYLELWPVLTLLFIPTSIGAWLSGLDGAKRFLFACIFPPLGVALAFLGLIEGPEKTLLPMSILFTLPMWGLTLGALILAATAKQIEVQVIKKEVVSSNSQDINELVDSDPNLRLVPVEQAQELDDIEENKKQRIQNLSEIEEQLHWPIDELCLHMRALENSSLPISSREHVQALSSAIHKVSNVLNSPASQHIPMPLGSGIEEDVFDLQSLVREAHDYIAPIADKKNIALSWFMSPHLAQRYKGNSLELLLVLRLLLESAVCATGRGAVQLAVRRVPERINVGHLLFIISDTGTGRPPHERSITALARAWDLSASYHGFLGVESNAHGATISFTVNFEADNPICENCKVKSSEIKDLKSDMQEVEKTEDNHEDKHGDNHENKHEDSIQNLTMHEDIDAVENLLEDPIEELTEKEELCEVQDIFTPQEEDKPQSLGNLMDSTPISLEMPIETKVKFIESIQEQDKNQDQEELAFEPIKFDSIETVNPIDKKIDDLLFIRPEPKEDKENKAPLASFLDEEQEENILSSLSLNFDNSSVKEKQNKLASQELDLNLINTLDSFNGDWVGEPMPIQKENKVQENNSIKDLFNEITTDNSLHIEDAKPYHLNVSNKIEEKKLTPKDNIKKQAHTIKDFDNFNLDIPYTLQADFNEWVGEPLPMNKNHKEQSPNDKLHDVPTVNADELPYALKGAHSSFRDDEWVGEPMSIQKDMPEYSNQDVSTPEDLSLIQERKERELADLDAEKRGRDELRYLKSFLDSRPKDTLWKSTTLDLDTGREWVGEPMPIQSLVAKEEQTLKEPIQDEKIKTIGHFKPILLEENTEHIEPNLDLETKEDIIPEELDPITQLLVDLDTLMKDINTYLLQKEINNIAELATKIIEKADEFGLRTLSRLAYTVQSAAKAKDLDALKDLTPELAMGIQRNKMALIQK